MEWICEQPVSNAHPCFGILRAMIRLRRLLNNPSAVVILNAGTQSVVRFLSNMILARLLLPTAFALTSITLLIFTAIHMASDVGIVVMTLRQKSMSEVEQVRMWTLQFTRGVLMSLLVLVLAKPTATFYHAPELAEVLFALSIVPTIEGARSLFPILELGRHNLMPNFWTEVLGRVVGSSLSIIVATISPTVWALALGILGEAVTGTYTSHRLGGKGWPKFDLNLQYIRNHWQFSRWIQLSSTLSFFASQIDKAVFPLIYGLARFGVYGIGATFAFIPTQITQRWSGSVFYPLVVKNINGDATVKNQLTYIRVTMLIYSSIIVIGMMGLSPGFFFILYKPLYREAARFAMLLTASSFFEMAELSLRYYPLSAKTSKYEFATNAIRIISLILFIALIWLYKGDAELYAMAYTGAQTLSWLFILCICIRDGHVKPAADLLFSSIIWLAIIAVYYFDISPQTIGAAFEQEVIIGIAVALLLGISLKKRGLPSPAHGNLSEIIRL